MGRGHEISSLNSCVEFWERCDNFYSRILKPMQQTTINHISARNDHQTISQVGLPIFLTCPTIASPGGKQKSWYSETKSPIEVKRTVAHIFQIQTFLYPLPLIYCGCFTQVCPSRPIHPPWKCLGHFDIKTLFYESITYHTKPSIRPLVHSW